MSTAARLIYAASETCADLWYESGFSAPDAFLWAEINGHAFIVVSPLEVGRASKQARRDVEVISHTEARRRWKVPEAQSLSPENLVPAISAAEQVDLWNVPHDFPFGLARRLEERGLSLRAVTPFSPGREVKSAEEVKLIRNSIDITQEGIRRAYQILQDATVGKDDLLLWNGEPLTSEILGAEINIAIARRGGTGAGTITAHGLQAADPHCSGFGPIKAHETIVMDVFPRCDATGYFGDLTRTVCKGTAPDIVRRAFEVVRNGQQLAMDMLRPGIPGADPHNAVSDFFDRQGFPTDSASVPARGFFHGLGHSFGLEIHESPALSPRNPRPLVPGNIVTVEPGLYYPEWGGIRIEDDALITETGAEKLSTIPVFLEI